MNNIDPYIYLIVALLPLSAAMVVLQRNPFFALIMRGILGAMAALTYTLLGAADVALTEALVGTLLAITLYAVAVRSSLVLRLGVLEDESTPNSTQWEPLLGKLRSVLDKHFLRLELVPFTCKQALQRALAEKEVHATCVPSGSLTAEEAPSYQTLVRVPRVYEILQEELSAPELSMRCVTVPGEPDNSMDKKAIVGEEQA
ncbi:DUF4040 domain-containing protein [Leptolyngbya ohadii]|uniref:DUF4040 domain-containing protein n=1 Tax=Leptolyngbya ohadii TaxID=1962290 RepID=UPI000B59CEE8|nr:DUF4040 domain-containing protein [Leptolyngbya ohadii]